MSLTTILNNTLDLVNQAKFAGVVGTDGLGIEMVFVDEATAYDLELAEIELASLAALATSASNRMGTGLVRGLTVETDAFTFLALLIAPDYFAVLGVPVGADVGQARSVLEQMVERMRAEL